MKAIFFTLFSLFLLSGAATGGSFFGGMVSQGSSGSQAGSTSGGASAGPGLFYTGGQATAGSQSGAVAGAAITPVPGVTFFSDGYTNTNASSVVGGVSAGNAIQYSNAGGGAQASEYHASGLILVLP